MATYVNYLYRILKWTVTPTAREVRVLQWLFENYIDWREPLPRQSVQEAARSLEKIV